MALFNNNKAKVAATSLKTVREQAANTIITYKQDSVTNGGRCNLQTITNNS